MGREEGSRAADSEELRGTCKGSLSKTEASAERNERELETIGLLNEGQFQESHLKKRKKRG